jgi:hypothetical protein
VLSNVVAFSLRRVLRPQKDEDDETHHKTKEKGKRNRKPSRTRVWERKKEEKKQKASAMNFGREGG